MASVNEPGKRLGKGISFPPRIGPEGRVAWSAGSQNVRECIRVILLTELEERVMLPEFGGGLKSFLFQPNTLATHRLMQERVTLALARWEPRIEVEDVSVEPDPADIDAALVTVRYRLVATEQAEGVTVAVRLRGG
jgi:hypothetical protein